MNNNVALYWDFENIHASLCGLQLGADWYHANRFTKQPRLVEVRPIMEFISTLGEVNLNKAFADWSCLRSYGPDLQEHALDLIQLFPRNRHGKNGADIRMAIEVIEDLTMHPHLSTVVIVGGDSDYVSIAQKVRQRGRTIIGIGVKETTNQYWVKACNQFKFYSVLLVKSAAVGHPAPVNQPTADLGGALEKAGFEAADFIGAKELLCRAVTQITAGSGESFARKALLRPTMIRLDPSFDEANYGLASLNDLVERCAEWVNVTRGEHDLHVSLREIRATPETAPPKSAHPYEQILHRQDIHLPSPETLCRGVLETFALFRAQPEGFFSNYQDYKDGLFGRLNVGNRRVSEREVSKIKGILFKSFAFRKDRESGRIYLTDEATTAEELLTRVHRTLIRRILDNSDGEADFAQISHLLYGNAGHGAEVERLASIPTGPAGS